MRNEILSKLERLQEYVKILNSYEILQNNLGDFDEFAKYISRYFHEIEKEGI
jgi:archaellum component FlaC